MPIDQTQRPRFFEGQYLSADQLQGILDASLVAEARDRIGAHTWGIAMGMNFKQMPSAGDPAAVDQFLQPGYAWDGFGRNIVILAPYKIPAERFISYVYDPAIDEPNGRAIQLWVGYREVNFDPPQPGFQSCDAADQNARVQETFEIYLGPRPTPADQRDPIHIANYVIDAQQALVALDSTAPQIYDASIPQQTLPDFASTVWLVPLGYIRWKPNPTAGQPGKFLPLTPDDLAATRAFRVPIGVVAGAVQAADGVIRLKDRTRQASGFNSPDLVRVEGDTRLDGKIGFRDVDGNQHDVPLLLQRNEANAAGGRDLQIVIGHDNKGQNHLSVGPLDAAGVAFQERVTIRDDGNVGVGTTAPGAKIHVQGGNIRWSNNSELLDDQGGSIELGGSGFNPGTGTPYIDFHFKGLQQAFNVRIINDADAQLTAQALTGPITLAVKGEVKLTPAANLFASGAVEKLSILRGTVAADGTILGGQGFSVNHIQPGVFEVKYSTPFAGIPSASVTQVYPMWSSFGGPGNPFDNVVINGIDAGRMWVVTGDDTNDRVDRSFTFIVMGPR